MCKLVYSPARKRTMDMCVRKTNPTVMLICFNEKAGKLGKV